MDIESLRRMLFNAIVAWYDDSFTEYHGLDDEKFIKRVCEGIGMTESDYKNIMGSDNWDCNWYN